MENNSTGSPSVTGSALVQLVGQEEVFWFASVSCDHVRIGHVLDIEGDGEHVLRLHHHLPRAISHQNRRQPLSRWKAVGRPLSLIQGIHAPMYHSHILMFLKCSATSGRRRRVRFQPPKVAPEPKREVLAAVAAKSMDGHWPPEIPAHMVFLHRVNHRIDRSIAPKEPQFESRGSLGMFEHVFQVQLDDSAAVVSPNVGPEQDLERSKPSPSQSSDGGATDEPKTPEDTQETDTVACRRVEEPALAGSLGSWPAENNHTIPHSPYTSSLHYHSRSSFSSDQSASEYRCHEGKDDDMDTFSSQLQYPAEVHWHHPFSAVDLTVPHEANLPGYEERRPSLASSREMSASPFGSPHPSDDIRLVNPRRLPHHTQVPMIPGQYAIEAVSPSMLTGHGHPHRIHPDHTLQHPSPFHLNKTHESLYTQPTDMIFRGLGQPHLYAHSAYTLPPVHHQHAWENRHDEPGSKTRSQSEQINTAGQSHKAMPATQYHGSPRPSESLLQPVHTAHHESAPTDRRYIFPGAVTDHLSDRALRPPYWNAQIPGPHPFDSVAHDRPVLPPLPLPFYPPPLYLNDPAYFQPPNHVFEGGSDRPLAYPSDLGRRVSWTEHFDFLQSHVQKRRRAQKDADKTLETNRPSYSHQCPLCERRFPRRNSLAIHLKWHYKDREGECFSSIALRMRA